MVTAWPARLAMFANAFHSTGSAGTPAASVLLESHGIDVMGPSSRGTLPPAEGTRHCGIGRPAALEVNTPITFWPETWRAASAGHHGFVPHPAVQVEVVPVGLAGSAVPHVGVQRMPVPGDLLGAIGPGGRAERAGDARSGRGAGHRRPVGGTVSVAVRLARAVRGERVHGGSRGVGEHGDAADLAGLEYHRAAAGCGRRGARPGDGD